MKWHSGSNILSTLILVYFQVGELVIASEGDLITRIKASVSTSMSSVGKYNSDHTTWDSDNAIDNVISGDPNTCSCCIGTTGDEPPWWQIDLGKEYSVDVIEIYGRVDNSSHEQYENVYIYIGNSSMETSNGTLVYQGNPNAGIYTFRIPIYLPTPFRYLIIRRFTQSVITLCEVKLIDQGNLIDRLLHTVITNQSSVFYNSTASYGSRKAIDRKENYDIDNCHCCSVTNNTPSPSWWQIDFRHKYLIDKVEVFGRQSGAPEQLRHAIIYASNVSIDRGFSTALNVTQVPGMPSPIHFIQRLTTHVVAQFLAVYLPHEILTLCEFNAFGTGPVCDLGFFGDECSSRCHCADKKPCYYLAGTCQIPGCLPGWKGFACDTECTAPKYGNNCSESCDTCLKKTCQNTDGLCSLGCNPGYQPDDSYCRRKCTAPKYGNNCSESCDTCSEKKCRNTDGLCSFGCIPGYKPDDSYCRKTCDTGTYGKNCTFVCSGHCLNGNKECDTSNGTCINDCERGFFGKKCDSPCVDGYFGDCTQVCNCKDNERCNKTDGSCLNGCDYGWRGNNCSLECRQGTYGWNCNVTCHNCLEGSFCDSRSGTCPSGCNPGFKGPRCDKNTRWHPNKISKTSMSSEVGNWSSDRAVDGDIGPDADKCQCCSGTENSHLSWWKLDFGESIPINRIVVYSRKDEKDFRQLDGFQLGLSNDIIYNASSFLANSSRMFSKVYEIILPNILSSYIRIQRPGVLSLCEVEVFKGACELGRFGLECALSCHCADNKPCDQVSGHCQSNACKTGWQGPSCSKKCPRDTFGDDCSGQCFCAENTCTHNYGVCPGKCRSGYHGPHCSEVGSEVQSNTAVIGGVVGGICALVVILLVICIIVYTIRRKNRANGENHYAAPNLYITPSETQEYDTLDNIRDIQRPQNNIYENEKTTGL